MDSKKKSSVPVAGVSRSLKTQHRKSKKTGPKLTLKQFVATLTGDQRVVDWFYNKKTNFKKPSLGLGSTRRKKGGNKQS